MTDTIKPSAEFITILEPNSVASEAFKTLRTNISLKDFDSKIKVINVISSISGESKSTVALNLAYSYSQLNKKTLLIDLDLRKPSIHSKLKVKNKLGIVDVATHRCKYNEAIIHYGNYFDVLLSGSKTPYAAELIQSESFKNLISACRNVYDMVIIDCPPINLITDGMIVSTYTDGTILCVCNGVVDKKELLHAKDQLEQFKVNMLGIVMTRVPIEKKKYGYGYGYGYYGESE